MTGLGELQAAFIACLQSDNAPLPAGWSGYRALGMDIYRNAYRSRLVDALKETFGRTQRLAGDKAFDRAAAHHLVSHPPTSWTLDDAGSGFAETCASLFAADPEVGEVAALEWALNRCFVAADARPLAAGEFALKVASYTSDDWSAFTPVFMPGVAVLPATHDLVSLWRDLADGGGATVIAAKLPEPAHALVWRDGERPVLILIGRREGAVLSALLAGCTYLQACAPLVAQMGEAEALDEAGAMLGRWLHNGIVQDAVISPATDNAGKLVPS